MSFTNFFSSLSPITPRFLSSETYKSENLVNAKGNQIWTYVDNQRKYQILSKNNQVVVKSDFNGNRKEMTFVAEEAKKIQNILSKIDLSFATPVAPIKPIQPIKPMQPLVLSFNCPEGQEIWNEYSQEVQNYIRECEKNLSDYEHELSKYKSEISLNKSKKINYEINHKQLINLLDRLFTGYTKSNK